MATPTNFGEVRTSYSTTETFSCCSIEYQKTIGGACTAGYAYSDYRIEKTSGGGTCEAVTVQPDGLQCAVTFRFHNNGLEGAICNITILQKRVCD